MLLWQNIINSTYLLQEFSLKKLNFIEAALWLIYYIVAEITSLKYKNNITALLKTLSIDVGIIFKILLFNL